MEIYKVIQHFHLDKEASQLEIYIGKNLNRQMFTLNNKIFFDVLLGYIQKNGWYVEKQGVVKSFSGNNVLQSTIQNKPSTLLEFSVPFTNTITTYKKTNNVIKKYRGTYYDIICSYYQKQIVDDELHMDSIYNEIIQEETIFSKKATPFTIHFNVEKGKDTNYYLVKVVFTEPLNNEEVPEELFELVDMAMAKYKKTDKTISSVFEPI
jgi:hypothetical protein